MNITEAMDSFRAEYESSEHWGSDFIIEFEVAETVLNELDKKENIINTIKTKLEKHIKFCEQEAKGHLNNEKCNRSINFEKGLLDIIEGE